jgi:hypothetical protein
VYLEGQEWDKVRYYWEHIENLGNIKGNLINIFEERLGTYENTKKKKKKKTKKFYPCPSSHPPSPPKKLCILRQKKNDENSNISPCKNIIFKKKLSKKNQILQDIITL